MRRAVPIRIRLTVGFALVMAVLLTGAGVYMHSRVAADLNAGVDRALHARIVDLTALVEQSESGLSEARTIPVQGDFAQILNARGRVADSTRGAATPVLDPASLKGARRHAVLLNRRAIAGVEGPVRILAKPVTAQDRHWVLVAGASLASRDRALDRVASVMLVGGPALLLLASLAGYGLAALALRPVERMRVRAEGIWTHGLHARLPRTGARDELDRLAATLNESLDRVESGLEREQGFVADASHELRTPLTILRAQLELLGSDPHLSEDVLRAEVVSAMEEVDRLAELADHMLLLARLDNGDLDVRSEPVAVGPLLERIGRRTALLEGSVVEVVDPDDDMWISGSEARIEQALMNLVDNGLRHGDRWARVEAHAVGDWVELHVLDDGPGLPPDLAQSAFERFTRGERARAGDGAGLGLAIVRAIAESHGGSAGAADRATRGADVWLRLPRLEPAAQAPSRLSAQSSDGR